MRRLSTRFAAIATATAVAGSLLLGAAPAQAHGYVSGAVVSRAAASQNAGLGSAAYEPQSLEAPKGFPQAGPADGKLASAGGLFAGTLDQQSADRWYKNPVSTGPLTLTWTFTAPHKTAQWRYYITKPDWNPNAPLTRSELTLLATVPHDGSAASANPSHTVTIPADYRGYHIIYAVWDIADTSNAFYNTIDLQISGSASTPMAAPTGLHTMSATSSSIQLMWTGPSNATGYSIERTAPDGTVTTATTTSPMYTDSGLAASSSYTYRVYATAGSARSGAATLTATTGAAVGTPVLAPVTGLHAMERSATTVQVMWTAPTGATSYRVVRTAPDGSAITRTVTGTSYDDSGLLASTSYRYTVTAIAADGRTSSAVELTVTTDAAPTTPSTPTTPSGYPEWNAAASYAKGDRVTHGGVVYEAQQPYRGAGDPTWITAPALWKAITVASTPAPSTPPAGAPTWNPSGTYAKGDRVTYNGVTYRAVQAVRGHGDPSWITAPALWQRV